MPEDNSADTNRCTYRDGPTRCAYLARVFPNCTEQSKAARPENGRCWGHHFHQGQDTLDASLRAVPLDFDYRTEHLVELTLVEYLAGPPREPGQEG